MQEMFLFAGRDESGMKYVILLSDGMAGKPLEELRGRTTLEAARTPVLDALAE